MNVFGRIAVWLAVIAVSVSCGTFMIDQAKFFWPQRRNVRVMKPRVITPEELERRQIERTTFSPEELPDDVIIVTDLMHTGGPQGGLTGALINEAFLIVCREDFHLPTRDDLLRENIKLPSAFEIHPSLTINRPDEVPNPGQFSIRLTKEFGRPKSIILTTGQVNGSRKLDLVIREQQRLVAEDFPRLLLQIGFQKAEPDSAKVDVSDLLLTTPPLDIVQIFARLRRLHAALRVEPASADILATVCDHYALLGSLIESHWGQEHRAFKSRAILYAIRGLQHHPEHPRLQASLALAYALTGMEYEALPLLQSLPESPDADAPEWLPALKAFASWNEPVTRQLAEENQPLARYLQMVAVELCGTSSQFLSAVTTLTKDHPECYRGSILLAHTGPLGVRRSVEAAQLEQFLQSFPIAVQNIPDMPESVVAAAQAVGEATAEKEKYALTAALIHSLKQAADHEDRAEPSLEVLAVLAENLHMIFAVQILNTRKFELGVDASEELENFASLLEHHAAKGIIGAYQEDPSKAAAAVHRNRPTIFQWQPSYFVWSQLRQLSRYNSEFTGLLGMIVDGDAETVTPDLIRTLNSSNIEVQRRDLLDRLVKICPDCPMARGHQIALRWEEVADRAEKWGEETSNPNLVNQLAAHYGREALIDEAAVPLAEKFYLRSLELDRSYDGYVALAHHYRNTGDRARYRETLLKGLDLPDLGLESARIHEQVAESFMIEGRHSEARPHAMQAAASYSAWGLACGAKCLERLGELEEAEKYHRAIAERYDEPLPWYFFCRRTGTGDVDEARTRMLSLSTFADPEQRKTNWAVANYYFYEGDVDSGIQHFKEVVDANPENDVARAYLSIMLMSAGRDEEIKTLWDADRGCSRQVFLFQSIVANEKLRIDWTPQELDFLEFFYPLKDDLARGQFLIGSLLYYSGEKEKSVPWLQRVEAAPDSFLLDASMAGYLLRQMDVPPAPPMVRALEERFPEARTRLPAIWLRKDNIPAATRQKLGETLLSMHPDFSGFKFWHAEWLTEEGELQKAEKLFDELIAELPRMLGLRILRASNLVQQKRFREARDELEDLLKTRPHDDLIQNNLAWIYAAAPEAELRNGPRALEIAQQLPQRSDTDKSYRTLLMAAAQAECGHFDEALSVIEKGLSEKALQHESPKAGLKSFDPKRFQELFRKRQPYHELPANSSPKFMKLSG